MKDHNFLAQILAYWKARKTFMSVTITMSCFCYYSLVRPGALVTHRNANHLCWGELGWKTEDQVVCWVFLIVPRFSGKYLIFTLVTDDSSIKQQREKQQHRSHYVITRYIHPQSPPALTVLCLCSTTQLTPTTSLLVRTPWDTFIFSFSCNSIKQSLKLTFS